MAGKALGVEHRGAGERVLGGALGIERHIAALGVAGEQQGALLIAVGEGGGGGILHGAGQGRAEVVAPVDVRGDALPLRLRTAHGDDGLAGGFEGVGDEAGGGVVVFVGAYKQFGRFQRGKQAWRVREVRAAAQRAEVV